MKTFALPLPRHLQFSFTSTILAFGLALFTPLCLRGDGKKYPPAHSVRGAALFRQYCASCHGLDGKGHGPAASALSVKLPDLTRIAARSGGEFPRARVRNIIEGTESPVAHGTREMPVWGPIFHEIDADQDLGNVRVDNLAGYLESIQGK